MLTVSDLSAFGQFGQVVLEQPNITAELSSHLQIDVQVWGMHFAVSDVKLNRALTFGALNGVPNVTLTVFTASLATDGSGRVIVSSTIVVGNPTIVSISTLGNITVELLCVLVPACVATRVLSAILRCSLRVHSRNRGFCGCCLSAFMARLRSLRAAAHAAVTGVGHRLPGTRTPRSASLPARSPPCVTGQTR